MASYKYLYLLIQITCSFQKKLLYFCLKTSFLHNLKIKCKKLIKCWSLDFLGSFWGWLCCFSNFASIYLIRGDICSNTIWNFCIKERNLSCSSNKKFFNQTIFPRKKHGFVKIVFACIIMQKYANPINLMSWPIVYTWICILHIVYKTIKTVIKKWTDDGYKN